MTRDNIFGMKAIVGIVLMLNLVCVPFTNAALAERNTEPMPYMPGAVPAWSFGSAEDDAGVAEVAAGVMGVVGVEAGAERQPEFEDHVLKDVFDFHEQAFETVFGRAYEKEDACYFFDQPLDESAYGTIVLGWNAANEPVDALVLLATPINASVFVSLDDEVTIVSAAHIAGTLESVGKQGFWGFSIVYDSADVRHHTLFLLSELGTTTQEMLMFKAGLLPFVDNRNGDECEAYWACMERIFLQYLACINRADATYERCLGPNPFGAADFKGGEASPAAVPVPVILFGCGLALSAGGAAIHAWRCSKARDADYLACENDWKAAKIDCKTDYPGCAPD